MANDSEDKDIENKAKDKNKKPTRPLRVKFIRYGAIAGIFGTLFAALQPWAMEKGISSQIKIDPSSPGYMFWEHIPLLISSRFWLFNVENPEEFMKGGKLRVREIGPFAMSQERWKEVIEFKDKRVKYWEWRNYTILHEKSVGSWDQEITILNPLVASIGSIVGDKLEQLIPVPLAVSPFVYSTVSALLLVHSQNIFLKTTPRNVIIGQRVNLLDTVTALIKPLELLGVKASDLLPTEDTPNNTFGLINGKNYTRMGPWEVFTGIDVPKENYAQVYAFKNDRLMKRWAGAECNTPKGTDGIQFQPLINRTTKLTVFAGDIYRSLDLKYVEDYDFYGISTYKYVIDPAMWEPPSVNPDNACYCVHQGKKKARCNYYGMLDLTGGFSGSPFVVTKPHFLDAPELQKQVDGLTPDPEKHSFYLLVKPDIGVPLSAKGRLQFNLRVEKVPFLRGFNNLRDTVFPLGWIEEGGELEGPLYYLMRGGLVIAPQVASAGFYAAAIGGWAAFLGGLIYVAFRKSGKGKIENMEKLFAPRVTPTKEELLDVSKKSRKGGSKLSMGQSRMMDQQSTINSVLVPVEYGQLPNTNNGIALMNNSGLVQGRSGPISIIPVNSDQMYQPSPVIQFYRLPASANQSGQFDQLLLTIPNSNSEMNSPGIVPKIMWTERSSKSVQEKTGKVREKMTRGRSLPRDRTSQRSKRIQVTSKETQDRFVQVDRDINGFRYAGNADIIKSYTDSQRNNDLIKSSNISDTIESEQRDQLISSGQEITENANSNTYENIENDKNLHRNSQSNGDETDLVDINDSQNNIESNLSPQDGIEELNLNKEEGLYAEVHEGNDYEANAETEELYDNNNRSQSPKTESILQNVSANLFASSSHISRSLIDMVITGNQLSDTENGTIKHDDDGPNLQARPSLVDAAVRSVSATLPGSWGTGKGSGDQANRSGSPRSNGGLRSTFSAVSRYQSIDPRESYEDEDETTLFQRDSTTESEAATPQSDERQEVKSYQREGVNSLPGVETPERLGTPSFSDEFSIGSDDSRASTAKSLIQPKNTKQESKPKSSCIVS